MLYKAKQIVEKSGSYFYLLFKVIFPPKKVKESNNVLLVSGGHLGDAVLDASAWEALIDHYYSQGKSMYLLASKEAWKVFSRVLDTAKIVYIENDFQGINHVFSSKKMLTAIEHMEFDTIIARFHGGLQICLGISATRARYRYVILEPEIFNGWRRFFCQLSTKRFSKIIKEPMNFNGNESVETLLHSFGLTDYRMHLLPIPKQCESSVEPKTYITVAVDSQNNNRRWGAEKFTELIEVLLRIRKEDIYLTGSTLSDEEKAKYNRRFANNARVKNTIGQLSFNEWIELIRGAVFHIGVDSGSIHIAASVGTTSFCLTGVWHGHRFFPYPSEVENNYPKIKTPVCIYRQDVDVEQLPCFGCAVKRKYGWGNVDCLNQCKKNLPCQCLDKITVQNVIQSIEKELSNRKD